MYLNLTEQVSSLELENYLASFMAEQRSRMPSGYRGRVNGLDGSGMLSPMDESLKVATILLFYLPALLSFLSSLPCRRGTKLWMDEDELNISLWAMQGWESSVGINPSCLPLRDSDSPARCMV